MTIASAKTVVLSVERRKYLARSSTNIAVHKRLAGDPADGVRACLATNKNIAEDIQIKLLARDDEFCRVRGCLARNTNITEAAQIALFNTPRRAGWDVRLYMADNPSITPVTQVLYCGLDQAACTHIHSALASNRSLTEETQLFLAGHTLYDVRVRLAMNPYITDATMRVLMHGPMVPEPLTRNPAFVRFADRKIKTFIEDHS